MDVEGSIKPGDDFVEVLSTQVRLRHSVYPAAPGSRRRIDAVYVWMQLMAVLPPARESLNLIQRLTVECH
jgi:hypothetical protein